MPAGGSSSGRSAAIAVEQPTRRSLLMDAYRRMDKRASAVHNERLNKFGTTAANAMRSPYKRQAKALDEEYQRLNERALKLFGAATGTR